MALNERRAGGCQCGQIRYLASPHPLALYVCHCTECQKQSASAFGISYTTPREQFTVVEGKPQFWSRQTASGYSLECAYCGKCGSRLWHQSTGSTETLSIKGGSLDDPVDVTGAIHIWTSSKLSGIVIPLGALSFEREPR